MVTEEDLACYKRLKAQAKEKRKSPKPALTEEEKKLEGCFAHIRDFNPRD